MMQRNLTRVVAEKRRSAGGTGNSTRSGSTNHLVESRLKKLADSLERFTDDDDEKNVVENTRLLIKSLLQHSYIGMFYRNIMLLFNIVACFEYIYSTYLHYSRPRQRIILHVLEQIEFVGGVIFSADWLFNLFLADHKRLYLISTNSIIDILTIIPIFTTYNVICSDYAENILDYSFEQIINFILCGLQTVRILRALRIRERFEFIDDEVQRFLANIISMVMTLILFNAALMNYLEYSQNYAFHTWIYYTTVTIATVGYGDVTPKTDIGRVAAMAFIITAIISVPRMTNELIEMMSLQSIYSRAHYVPKSNSQHVVICGHLSSAALLEVFEELFHEDHDIRGLHCVIIQPFVPTYEMLQLLHDPKFQLSLTYLEGSTLNDKDLQRACANTARAIFIMTNKFSLNPDEEDAKTILQQFSIQKFIRLYSNQLLYQPLFCIQLIRPENKRHLVTLEKSGLNENMRFDAMTGASSSSLSGSNHHHQEKDLVICLNEIKMGVIAKAVIFPGANTLIMNLMTSFSDEVSQDALNTMKPMDGIETLEEDEHNSDWIGEYQRGCDWEIYTTELSSTFEGTAFVALSEILYQKLGVILFGLEIEELKKEKSQPLLLLNPAEFIIPSSLEFRILGFVIAKNKSQSDLTFNKLANQDPIFNSGMAFSQLSLLTNAMSMVGNNGLHVKIGGENEGSSVSDEDQMIHNDRFIKGRGKDFYQASLKKASSPHHKDKNNKKRGRNTILRQQQPWQWLLKRYEQKKTTETMQEEVQRLEDSLLREHYFIRENSFFELSDAYIRSSVMEEIPFIEGHIIIIGKALSNLYDLIRPLRARSLGILKPIIILYPKDFPHRVWQRIKVFESVWIVRGSGLEDADIRRCGIFKAKQVVLLADAAATANNALSHGRSSSSASAVSLNALDDADAIFCYQAVRRMNETCHIVVEIVRHTNVSYLDPESGLNSTEVDYKFTPQFAAGALFATSLLDTLVCQAFYNTKIIEILNLLVGGVEKREIEKATNQYYKNQQTTSKQMKGWLGSSLYQIPLPDGLASRTYGALYSLLAKRKQIPLGILRGVFTNTKSGPKANVMPYVFTNPPKDTELFSCDKIFVLSQTPVKITRMTKDDTKEIHIYSTIRSKKKTAEDVLNVVDVLYGDVREQTQIHEKLEDNIFTFDDHLRQLEGVYQQMEALKGNIANAPPTPQQRARTTSKDRDSIYSIHSTAPTARSVSASTRTTRFTLNRPQSGDEYHHRNSSPSRFSMARKRTFSEGNQPSSSPSARTSLLNRKSMASSTSSPLTHRNSTPVSSANNNNSRPPTPTSTGSASPVRRRIGMTPSPNSSPSKMLRKRIDKT